jgi:manganese/iron transport system substrate-binding protein
MNTRIQTLLFLVLIGVAAVFLFLFLGGENTSKKSSQGGKKKVVTTFTILADMAQNVAGDKADVVSITKPGAEIHEYEPTPGDIIKAQSADLVINNGLGLERWFQKFLTSVGDVKHIDCSTGIKPIGISKGPYADKPNPHSWMSPKNAKIYVLNIRNALIDIDPANKEAYLKNAEAYLKKLSEIDERLQKNLHKIPQEKRWLVTSEGAFSYLIRDYGLQELYLWPVNSDQEGTPQQIQYAIDIIKKFNIPVVFSESTISDKPQRQVSKESGAAFGGILFVDSLSESTGPAPTYIELLTYNTNTILKGFGVL